MSENETEKLQGEREQAEYEQDGPDMTDIEPEAEEAGFEEPLAEDDGGEEAEPEESVGEEPEAEDSSLPEEEVEPTMESVIEAVLFASDEPLSARRLAEIADVAGVKELRGHIDSLNEKYRVNNNAFRIEQIAGGYQMLTLSTYNQWLRKLLRARDDSKLSQAALETLAIIAYKQPIIRADVEAIRGVGCGEMIRSLMYKGLVKIVGKAEVLGRPLLYGTTKKFLEVFGLNSLKDLPKTEELKQPE